MQNFHKMLRQHLFQSSLFQQCLVLYVFEIHIQVPKIVVLELFLKIQKKSDFFKVISVPEQNVHIQICHEKVSEIKDFNEYPK